MQHMTEGGFGRLQIVRVLDRDVKLVHRKAGPAALRVGPDGLFFHAFSCCTSSFSFRMCGFFRFYP